MKPFATVSDYRSKVPSILVRVPLMLVRVALILGLAICLACANHVLAAPQAASAGTGQFVIFDAPGAGTQVFQGTTPTYINDKGEILGWVQDANNVFHGFLRSAQGEFTIFDVPAAGTDQFQGTFAPGVIPNGFNNHGDAAGEYVDGNNTPHAFIRNADGTILAFDAPESVAGSFADAVNTAGIAVGGVNGANFVHHAFVRTAIGTFVMFDAPDAGSQGTPARYQGTLCTAINNANEVIGVYADANNQRHGFVRDRDGNLTEFQVPGAAGRVLAYPYSINSEGNISGFYGDANGANHGFLRKRDGEVIPVDVEGAGTAGGQGTFAEVISDSGEITGAYYDANVNGLTHGFVRKADGTILTFDVPGAGADQFQGTFPGGINARGDVTGSFTDANNVIHGFLLRRSD